MVSRQQSSIARAVREALNHPVAGALALVLAAGSPGVARTAGLAIHGGTYGPPGPSNDATLDYLLIDSGAVVNGDVTNTLSGTIAGTPDDGPVAIFDSTVNGAVANLGSLGSSDLTGPAVWVRNSTLASGIQNTGAIQSQGDGIYLNGGVLIGGIHNSGGISAENGIGIDVESDHFEGDISNTGSVVGNFVGIGAYVWSPDPSLAGPGFSGAIVNTGTIQAGAAGILAVGTVAGGIRSTGTIEVLGLPVGPSAAATTNQGWGILALEYFWDGSTGFTGGIANSGTIVSATEGIGAYVSSFEGGIANAGRIQSGNRGIDVQGDWWWALGSTSGPQPGLSNFTGGIVNSGTIEAGGDGIRVWVGGFQGGISNSGRIQSQGTGIKLGGLGGSDWWGIASSEEPVASGPFSGGISNSGTIVSGAGDGIGVFTQRFDGGIQNSGLIQSRGTGIRLGGEGWLVIGEGSSMTAFDGGTFSGGINNSGTIASSAGDGIAVQPKVFEGAIVNSGLIDAPAGVGIRVVSNIQGGILNTGTIRGGVAAIDTRAATGPTVINLNGGAVLGDIDLSPAFADTVNATAGTMTGNILATGPRDDRINFVLGGATFTLNGNIQGADVVFVDPGTLYLNGNVTGVNRLNVDGGTTLVLGRTANISPVSYAQAPTATLAFAIGADGSHGTVNAENVTLAGNLGLPLPTGLPAPAGSTVYSNLVTWTTRSGFFNAFDTGSIFLAGNLLYGPNSLSAEIGRLPFNRVPAGLGGNGYAVATGIENAYPGAYARGDAQSVAFYSPIFDYSVGQYTQFLAAASGSTYANTLQATLYSTQLVNSVVNQRLNGAGGALGVANLDPGQAATATGARSAWATVLGSWGNSDGDGNAPGFSQDTGGIALGLDYRLNAQTLVGVLASYLRDHIDFDNNSNTDVDTWQLGAYGQYDTERWYANGLVTVGWNNYDSQRRIVFTGVNETAEGNYDGTTFVIYGEGGYKLPIGDVTFKPMLGFGYANGDVGSFSESGGGLYRLRVNSASTESLTSNLGLRALMDHKTTDGTLITGEAHVIWQHEFLDNQPEVGASFAVLPGSGFTVNGTRFARDSAVLGLGLKARVAATTEVFLNYDAKLGSDYTANALFAGARVQW